VSDQRDGVTPGSDDAGAIDDASAAPDAEVTQSTGDGHSSPDDGHSSPDDSTAPDADTPEAGTGDPAASTRPTGKRRSTTAGARPDRSRPATAGSKRSAGRVTATRSAAEAPARRGPLSRVTRFMREVAAELRKVIWPTRKELVTYTTVVLVFVSFMVALVSGLDILFAKGVLALFG